MLTDHGTEQKRPWIYRRRPDRMPQCGRRLMVDGPLAPRPPHGRSVSLQLCSGAGRELPTRANQSQHVANDGRVAVGCGAAEAEERLPQAVPGLQGVWLPRRRLQQEQRRPGKHARKRPSEEEVLTLFQHEDGHRPRYGQEVACFLAAQGRGHRPSCTRSPIQARP